MKISPIVIASAVATAAAIFAPGTATCEQREIVIGIECDRTGPTQIVGVNICPGYQDYINLVNSRGGVEGYRIKGDEIDIEYKVPPAVEAYERQKAEGAVSIMLYGTPQTQALTQKLNEDKIPGTSAGFGTASAANGLRYPYLFPIAATYWTQGAAAIKFVKEKLGGSLDGKKIAYLLYDNPSGHEPLAIFEELRKVEKFELKTFAVPPPGVETATELIFDELNRRRALSPISRGDGEEIWIARTVGRSCGAKTRRGAGDFVLVQLLRQRLSLWCSINHDRYGAFRLLTSVGLD